MKKAILTGLALTVAAGIGCAKDMSVYSPQPEILAQNGTEIIYRQVSWDRERIDLTVLTTENGIITSGTVWTRYEPTDSAECARIELHSANPVRLEISETEIIEGIETQYFSDESCDRTFEEGPNIYVFSDDPEVIEEQTQQWRGKVYDSYMQAITTTFNVEQLLADWHNAKRL